MARQCVIVKTCRLNWSLIKLFYWEITRNWASLKVFHVYLLIYSYIFTYELYLLIGNDLEVIRFLQKVLQSKSPSGDFSGAIEVVQMLPHQIYVHMLGGWQESQVNRGGGIRWPLFLTIWPIFDHLAWYSGTICLVKMVNLNFTMTISRIADVMNLIIGIYRNC
jgi:hypothetical protein